MGCWGGDIQTITTTEIFELLQPKDLCKLKLADCGIDFVHLQEIFIAATYQSIASRGNLQDYFMAWLNGLEETWLSRWIKTKDL